MYKKVYIIDDDEISVFLTEMLLEVEQFAQEFKGYLCPKQALDDFTSILQNGKAEDLPTILFLDLNMPFMSGWDFLEELTPYADLVKSYCKIFILTSSVDTLELEKAEKYPLVAGVLHKPLEDVALNRVRELI